MTSQVELFLLSDVDRVPQLKAIVRRPSPISNKQDAPGRSLMTEWYWLVVLGLLVVGLVLASFSTNLREGQPRLASILFGTGFTLLSLWICLVSGLAGL